MMGSQNFVVHLQIRLKIGVMRGSHHLNNSLSPCQIPRLWYELLSCQASFIHDLFDDGYDVIIAARFESDPLEMRFGQYRQISGGQFLVGLKDTICSKNF